MRVFLIGIDHYLQPYELQEFQEEVRVVEREIKEHFYNSLEELMDRERIQRVAEECRPNQDTIPRRLAQEKNTEWVEIDMPLPLRRINGIPDDYERGGADIRANGFRVREQHMVAATRRNAGDDTRVAVVVGTEHLAGLQDLFAAAGDEVDVRDLTVEEWFDPPCARRALRVR